MKRSIIIITTLIAGLTMSISCSSEDIFPPNNVKQEFVSNSIVTLDLSYLNSLNPQIEGNAVLIWDKLHMISSLQGIVNRDIPQLYIYYVQCDGKDIDRYWWNKYRDNGKWLSKAHVSELEDIVDVVNHFREYIKGAVVYDPKVDATSNIASSIAGIEDLIAIRYDLSPESMYSKLILNGPKIPVKVRLIKENGDSMFTGVGVIPGTDKISTESAKLDAYTWFVENYLKTGKVNTSYGAYYIDQYWIKKASLGPSNHHTLTNHDFFIANKSFFFDLSPWSDERATDDPKQRLGGDNKILKEMLLLAYRQNNNGKQFTYIGGFPPWAYKYTQRAGGIHEDVETEWGYSQLISSYNAFKDADAIGFGALANASFWMHFPLKTEYPQKWISKEELQKKGYLDSNGKLSLGNKELFIFYVGDYDASSWLYQTTPSIWDDPERGKLPLMWCISPVLAKRVPMAWDYRRETASPNDYFAAADNGAGYLNPGELQEPRISGLPSGIDDWAEHCKPYYAQWGLSITGFIIDGFANPLSKRGLAAYAKFSPNGIVPQKTENSLYNNMPILRSVWDVNDDNPRVAASVIVDLVKQRDLPFHWFRNILKKPSWYVQVVEEISKLNPNIVLVDAPTFFELYRIYLKQQIK